MKARNERRLGFAVMGLRPKPRDLTHWGPGEGLRRPAKKKGGTKSASPFPRSPVRRSGCVPAEPYPPCGPGKNSMSSGFAADFLREAFLNRRVLTFRRPRLPTWRAGPDEERRSIIGTKT